MKTASAEEIAKLDQLFDACEGISTTTDEDYHRRGETFNEDE